jgi:hypothetical protein
MLKLNALSALKGSVMKAVIDVRFAKKIAL